MARINQQKPQAEIDRNSGIGIELVMPFFPELFVGL